MKLLLRRNQKTGMLGKIIFIIAVRAELSDEEKPDIKKYKLGDTMLYERSKIVDPGSGLLGMACRAWIKVKLKCRTIFAKHNNIACIYLCFSIYFDVVDIGTILALAIHHGIHIGVCSILYDAAMLPADGVFFDWIETHIVICSAPDFDLCFAGYRKFF